METPQHLFALTKGEQRVVLLIMIGMLAATGTIRYLQKVRAPANKQLPATTQSGKPDADEDEEEQ